MLMHALVSARPDLRTGTSVGLQKGRPVLLLTTDSLFLLPAATLLPPQPSVWFAMECSLVSWLFQPLKRLSVSLRHGRKLPSNVVPSSGDTKSSI